MKANGISFYFQKYTQASFVNFLPPWVVCNILEKKKLCPSISHMPLYPHYPRLNLVSLRRIRLPRPPHHQTNKMIERGERKHKKPYHPASTQLLLLRHILYVSGESWWSKVIALIRDGFALCKDQSNRGDRAVTYAMQRSHQ